MLSNKNNKYKFLSFNRLSHAKRLIFYLFSDLPLAQCALFAKIAQIQLQKIRLGAKAC